jgi:hypothetical protein
MINTSILRTIFFALLGACLLSTASIALGQEASQSSGQARQATRDDDTNLDTQLYLILATNREVEEGKLPAALDAIVKRLRDTLPFKHYTLAGTFLNRVKNNGRLDVSWVGGPFVSASTPLGNPSFNQFGAIVTLTTDADGAQVVRLREFRFGARVPIVTGRITTTNASTVETAVPVVNYESVGLHTDLSIREGVPAIAGTLTVGPSGDAIIVAISARRAN